MEAFCDGHNSAFSYFGGVPLSVLYDNTKLAVGRIEKDGTRRHTQKFDELMSHYLFEARVKGGIKVCQCGGVKVYHSVKYRPSYNRRGGVGENPTA